MIERAESILRARFLVACLGERASPPWWRSEATSAVSRRMLERLYPRTYLAASLDSAGRAASIEHDSRIGRIGTYHLFRLPTRAERAIHEMVLSQTGLNLLRKLAALQGRDRLVDGLDDLAGGASLGPVQGPVRCGLVGELVGELERGRALQRMCAAYVQGFRNARPVYPYLDSEESR